MAVHEIHLALAKLSCCIIHLVSAVTQYTIVSLETGKASNLDDSVLLIHYNYACTTITAFRCI